MGDCITTELIHRAVNMFGNVYNDSATLAEICKMSILINELLKKQESTVSQATMHIRNENCFGQSFTSSLDCPIIQTNSVAPRTPNYSLATVSSKIICIRKQ